MPKIRGHNPDDCIEITVEADSLPNRTWVTAVRSPPKTGAEHRSFNESRPLIVRGVDAAQLGPRREHREIIRARRERLDPFRIFTTCKICIGGPYRRNFLKNIGPVAQVS
jgi:hypothetical protein